VKAKLSLTLDDELVAFVDRQPGATRSEKVEAALRRYRSAWHDMKLREDLAAFNALEDHADTAAWRGVMQEVMWSESGPPRSRGRR
jgi:metal-responsive CopG/Arc/MetJ family transcriptional regulator